MTANRWSVDNYELVGALEDAVYGRRMRWVTYFPAEPLAPVRYYQRAKHEVRSHPFLSIFLGAAGLGGISLAWPDLWPWVKAHKEIVSMVAAGSATVLGFLDRQVDPQPESEVRRTFIGIDDMWSQAYQRRYSDNPTRDVVDRYVSLARNPNFLTDDIGRAEDPEALAKKLGVLVSLAADLLAAWGKRNDVRARDPLGLLQSVMGEKAWQPADEEALEKIRAAHKVKEVLRLLRGGQAAAGDAALAQVDDLLKRPDLQLRVYLPPGFPIHHLGTQMSRGSVRVTGVPGNSAFSYLGLHDAAARPYVFLQDGSGPFCASNQRGGLVVSNGPAGREPSKDQKGGVACYLSDVGDGAFVRMNGPAVGILYRPADPERIGPVRNGRLVLLEQGASPRPPTALRYSEGKCVESVPLIDMATLSKWVKEGLTV